MKQEIQSSPFKDNAEQQAKGVLSKLIVATGTALLLAVLGGFYYRDLIVVATLSVGIAILIVPYFLLRVGRVSAASTTLTLLLIGVLTASATAGQGLNDLAIIAFPIIYLFTSISLNRTVFKISLGFTFLAIFWLTFGEVNGWYIPQPFPPISWVEFLLVAVVLGVAAFASDLLTTTLRKNLERAEYELSERILAEEALKESEEKYRLIVENANDGIEITQDDKILFSNPRFAEMLGYTTEEMLNAKFSQFFTEQAIQSLYDRENKRKNNMPVPTSYETSFRKKDGTIIQVDVKYEIIEYKEKPATFAIIRDVTERKEAEEALAESDSLRELLLDIITHDLKNPAGVIYALSETAKREMPDNKIADAIHTSSGRLIEVLNQTSILSQAAFGEAIPKEALSLDVLIEESADEFAAALNTAEMELVFDKAQGVTIIANPLIREVFKNYISNAIKYARDGKRIVVETVIEDQTVVVRVKDFGKTIAETDRDLIFQRRIQLENGKESGRGLGLAIVKRIALAHDGEVWVEPNTPAGNSFCLRIPL